MTLQLPTSPTFFGLQENAHLFDVFPLLLWRGLLLISVWNKIHRNRVDTVSNILFRETFASKNMTQMRPTLSTLNLSANSIRIRQPLHRTRNFVIEAWPSTTGFELALRPIKRRTTPPAHVGATLPKSIILASKRTLRTLMNDDLLLFLSQLPMPGFFLRHLHHQYYWCPSPHLNRST